LIYVESFMIVT